MSTGGLGLHRSDVSIVSVSGPWRWLAGSWRWLAMSKAWLLACKLAVSSLILGYLFWSIGPGLLLRAAREVSIPYVLLSCGLLAVTWLVAAVRLQILMRPTVLRVPLLRLYRIIFISHGFGLFLPAGVGISLATWYKVMGGKVGRFQFALVTVVEKSSFVFSALSFIAICLLFASDGRSKEIARVALPICALGLVATGCFLVMLVIAPMQPALSKLLARWAANPGIASPVSWVRDLSMYRGRSKDVLGALLLSVAVQVMIVGRLVLLILAVGVGLPWITMVWMSSVVFLLQTLPVSFAGLGVRESGFAYAFALYGAAPEAGVLVGVLFFLQLLGAGSLGLLFELTDTAKLYPAV